MNNTLLFIITILGAVFSFVLGIIVLINDRKKYLNISFAILTTSLSTWAITVMMQKVTEEVFWGRMIFIPIPFLVVSLLLFSLHFPKSQEKLVPKTWQGISLLFFTILLLLLGTSPLVLKGVEKTSAGLTPIPGDLLGPYYLVCGIVAIASIGNLIRKYFKADPENKLRMQYFVLGVVIMMVSMMVLSLGIPLIFGTYEPAFYAPSLSIILVAFTTFSIIRYRLLGLKFIAGKILQTILVGIIGFLIFYVICILHTLMWGSVFAPGALILGFLMTLIVAPLFILLSHRIGQYLDTSIVYSDYNPFELINKLLKETSTELDLDNVVLKALHTAHEAFGQINAGIVLFDRDSKKITYMKFSGFEDKGTQSLVELMEVVSFWNFQEAQGNKSEILVKYELSNNIEQRAENEKEKLLKVLNFMKSENVSVLLPLNRKVQLNGLMLVGSKPNNKIYTAEDIDFLESIIANTSVSVGRALLYREVQGFAKTLEQRVNDQTQEISKKNQELEEQLRKERDMMDILGHELRTPLSIARNAAAMIDMTLKKDTEQYTAKPTIRENTDRLLEHLRREVKILETVLSSTQIDHERLKLSITSIDCNDVVNDSIDGLKTSAQKKNIELKSELPNETIYCQADRDQIQRVIDNIVDNAVKYTQKGGVTIRLEDLGTMVKFSVIDTGDGIPKEDIPKLGRKFFRANTYLESSADNAMKVVRPGGTGIGLYVVFELVKMMGGKIEITSELGKGSTFMVYLPTQSTT